MRKKWHLVTGLLLMGMTVYTALLYYGILHLNNPDRKRYPVRGIDVSHHQGKIDWQHLPHEDVQFAYIKATEGGDFKDSDFQTNWRMAKLAGIPRGAYHYFNFCRDGLIQAKNFIDSVPVEADALPPAIDLEPGACESDLSKETIITELKILLAELQQVYGKPPLLYVTHTTYKRYVEGDFQTTPLWVRDVYRQPNWLEEHNWMIWQYDSRTRMTGISTYVDMNVFHKNDGSCTSFSLHCYME